MTKETPTLSDIALAYQHGELDKENLEWIFASEEKRKHMKSVYETDVPPQQIATILINDWEPVRIRNGLDHFDVPAYQVRDCINQYVNDVVSKQNLIVLFEHFASAAVERKQFIDDHTVEELADMVKEQRGWN